ncbi:hypothetical protein [Enterococcus sp. SMC-9]|uniref:hypothetical protein n=1 Tax=Enterococcus sp. SMC-9 TaxID=2862343 RepID=UPI001E479D10|nr:hypothetical protein [Enterococcus sp. SMC-9]MCD1024805.1 hypothetical protein [Enterococcus sp. SMC-9]
MSIFDRLKDGFDLADISGIIGDLQKEGNLNFDKILSNDFIKQFTDFNNKDELLDKLGIHDLSQLSNLLQNSAAKEKIDGVINHNSQFANLEELLKKALKR